ncbi:hypothetical protein HNV08_12930 [Winogradskyella eckloniae]|uniref:STM3941 family protein n=1 Tax=Winogradskyella eckloniae TaxID=1089306 RepID=UPI00156508C7|nr:STM3941 family protein [Winogradskyella eckloniae]NRD20954.1 hypothetical protein [Winogradskyella eckloniae]
MRNEPKIFKQNKLKNLILFLISSVFVTIGILMLKDKTLMGWFIISFFGLGIIVSLIQFHPNASYLKLTDEGFETKNLFRSNFTKWDDVKEFRQGHINGNKMIFFDYTDEHKKWISGKKVAKFLSGKEGAVQSSYNIKTEELLNLMKEYKLKSK